MYDFLLVQQSFKLHAAVDCVNEFPKYSLTHVI